MSTPIIMPRLGDFMTEGVITKIYKSSGDFVKQGEIIVEIETEKIPININQVYEINPVDEISYTKLINKII